MAMRITGVLIFYNNNNPVETSYENWVIFINTVIPFNRMMMIPSDYNVKNKIAI